LVITATDSNFKQPTATSLRANGSRECAPDDRLHEAIHRAASKKAGLLRRFRLPPSLFELRRTGRSLSYGGQVAPRNDVKTHIRDLAARCARGLPEISLPSNQRAQGMPGARCARSLACKIKKHTSVVTTVTPVHPAFPTQWFTTYFVLSPATGLFCHRRPRKLPFANLTPASGRQDHTSSPSASSALVRSAIRVHRIPPRVDDVAQRPSRGGGTESQYSCFYPAVK
jgi:hypothetical protein